MGEERGNYDYKITASYVEIFKNEIRDLTRESPSVLRLTNDPDIGVHASGAQRLRVTSETDLVVNLLGEANKRREKMSNFSKRRSNAHTILTLYVLAENTAVDLMFRGKIVFVDLADSTRISPETSRSSHGKLVAGKHTNKDLDAISSVLMNVKRRSDDMLMDQSHNMGFDGSTLTGLLQDVMDDTRHANRQDEKHISQHGKVMFITCLSPSSLEVADTHHSLKFSKATRSVVVGKAQQQRREGVIENLDGVR